MTWINIIFYIWTAALLIGTLIPLMREQTYWLRAWTYARLQMLTLIGLSVLVLIFGLRLNTLGDSVALVALGLSAVLCLYDIYPFTPLARKSVASLKNGQPHQPISMLIANVLMENDNHEAMLEKIKRHDPDLIFLVETNKRWADAMIPIHEHFTHRYLLPLEDFNGMLFYSKFPILNAQERYLVQEHIPSLTLDLDMGGEIPLRLYGVHPRPPRPEDKTKHLDNELLFVANEAGEHKAPVVVTGDLNDVGWSSTTRRFLRVSGLRDPRRGRGLYNSYNAKNPLVRWPLDHLFHSEHFALKNMQRLDASGSDHFPLLIDLALLR